MYVFHWFGVNPRLVSEGRNDTLFTFKNSFSSNPNDLMPYRLIHFSLEINSSCFGMSAGDLIRTLGSFGSLTVGPCVNR